MRNGANALILNRICFYKHDGLLFTNLQKNYSLLYLNMTSWLICCYKFLLCLAEKTVFDDLARSVGPLLLPRKGGGCIVQEGRFRLFSGLIAACLLPIACCLLPFVSLAQTRPYFQQEVNYNIQVALDDRAQTLTGDIEMEYINHSPDALPVIWVHLWGNAFKNRRSAFAQQKLKHGEGRFYFAADSMLGFYKNLDFAVNGQQVAWKFDPENPDIAVVTLAEPLAPGARLRLATPFVLRIPASFSRLGHVGESYQITQWYPKPAVYDHRGWHAMPYLDQGEFYSEFGNFDVTITLPDNYVVGATGLVQNASEIAFLAKKEAESREKLRGKINPKEDPFPPSSTTPKTLHYRAERVHDFAWFADKRFMIIRDTAHLASGRTVDCWAMFTNSNAELWKKSAFYVRRSLEFYSEKVGEYPWPQATAVHSALSAGGGMEYPMITVINDENSAKSLDEVITHEVGHNWFYGILASNERDHPFLDEGFNSYYEQRYMQQYWSGGSLADGLKVPKWLFKPKEQGSLIENGYLMLAREHLATPPDSPSDEFKLLTYGLDVYMKTALCMAWLEQAAGTAKFDAAMHTYFQEWKFRHPYPEDAQAVLQKAGLEAGWFFQTLQTERQADYALQKVETKGDRWTLDVENKGDLQAPFSVTAMQDGQPGLTQWYPATTGQRQTVDFPAANADAFVIDYQHATLDINRKNNTRRTSGLLPGLEPLEFKLLAPIENPTRTTLAVLPWIGWNAYDQIMLGGVLYNAPFPPRKFQYYLAPGYAFGSRQLVGLVDLRYKLFPGGVFPKITLGVSAKTFNFDQNTTDDYYSKYYRFVPQIRAELENGGAVSFRHFLNFRTLFIGRETPEFDVEGLYLRKRWSKSTIFEVRYEAVQKRLPNPHQFMATLESQPQYRNRFDQPGKYLKGSLEWKQQFYYQAKRKVTARAFVGYFLQNTERHSGVEPVAFALNPQGFNDYRFDEVYFGRSDDQGFRAQQVSQREGGFKNAFGSAFGGTMGNSNNYILALNLKADLPARLPWGLPLRPWLDIGYFDDATTIGANRPAKEQVLWSGGLMLEFLQGNLEVYFPLFNSKNLKERYCEQSGGSNTSAIFCGGNYFKWISFSANIHKLDPNRILDQVAR